MRAVVGKIRAVANILINTPIRSHNPGLTVIRFDGLGANRNSRFTLISVTRSFYGRIHDRPFNTWVVTQLLRITHWIGTGITIQIWAYTTTFANTATISIAAIINRAWVSIVARTTRNYILTLLEYRRHI